MNALLKNLNKLPTVCGRCDHQIYAAHDAGRNLWVAWGVVRTAEVNEMECFGRPHVPVKRYKQNVI